MATLPAWGQAAPPSAPINLETIKGKRGAILEGARQAQPSLDQAEALMGQEFTVSGSRAAKSGQASTNEQRSVKVRCGKGVKTFSSMHGVNYRVTNCSAPATVEIRVCGPDEKAGDSACPVITPGGAPVNLTVGPTQVSSAVTACAVPETEKCDFRVSITAATQTQWSRDTIESEGQAASLRTDAFGAKANRDMLANPEYMTGYNAVNRGATQSRLTQIQGEAKTDPKFALGAECKKVCLNSTGTITTTKTCAQSVDGYSTGCQTLYPRVLRNYNIGRADTSCSGPGGCSPASPPPAGYGGWILYRSTTTGTPEEGFITTNSYASFENFPIPPPASRAPSSVSRPGPPITQESRCEFTGRGCVAFDSDVPSQCRVHQERFYCPFDRQTRCTNPDFIEGRPPPPAGTANATQFDHPGPVPFSLPDSTQCSYGDTSLDVEMVEDGQPTCGLLQDGRCVDLYGGIDCQKPGEQVPPPCDGPQYANCTISAQGCISTSPLGACETYEYTYECVGEDPTCKRYRNECTLAGQTYVSEENASANGWTEAITAASFVDQATSEGKDQCHDGGDCDLTNIKVFSGKGEACVHQKGAAFSSQLCDWQEPDYSGASVPVNPCIGGAIRTNCCDLNVNEEQDGLIGGRCGPGDIKLAAARRQNRAHKINDRCTLSLLFGGCLERTHFWCYFPSVMAKEVNVQGRRQLDQFYAVTDSTTGRQQNLAFDVFSTSQTGNWTPMVTLDSTRVMAWQWPSYCNAATDPRQTQTNCGSFREVLLMTCQGQGCAAPLPTHPTNSTTHAPKWTSVDIPRHGGGDKSIALGRMGFLEGGCNGTRCELRVGSATEVRSRSNVGLIELDWPYTDPDSSVGERVVSSNYAVMVFPNPPGTAMTTRKRVGISANPNFANPNATTYTQVDVPIDGTSLDVTVGGKTIKVQGECNTRTQICTNRFYVPIEVKRKRWNKNGNSDRVRNQGQLDCSGFTPEEFAMIDFSKLDLRAVIESMAGNNLKNMTDAVQITTDDLASRAGSVVGQKESEFNAGRTQVRNNSGHSSDVVTLAPAAGRPPWTTNLRYPGRYPDQTAQEQSTNPNVPKGTRVTQVTVDWGDGNTSNTSPGSEGMNNVSHTYERGAGKMERNYEIRVTFTLENGLTRVVRARAASRYDDADLSRRSGGAQDSVTEKDTRGPSNVPAAR